MPRKDRLRRTLILARDFARNLAYYHAAHKPEHRDLFDPAKCTDANFWIVTVNNSLDMCVLDWCKLFADPSGKHYWANIVADPALFKADLLGDLGLNEEAFQKLIQAMLRYRDKFLAHLDSDYVMNIPTLDIAMKTVWFYHRHIVDHEARPGDLTRLPLDLHKGYVQEQRVAVSVYSRGC